MTTRSSLTEIGTTCGDAGEPATPQAMVERRLRHWRGRLSIIAEALGQELRKRRPQSMTGIRAFLYREKFTCTTVIAELERLAQELDGRG
jgi:hypothetical protein